MYHKNTKHILLGMRMQCKNKNKELKSTSFEWVPSHCQAKNKP